MSTSAATYGAAIVEIVIGAISPKWAYNRSRYRRASAAYEAANPGRLRRSKADNASGDEIVLKAGASLRGYARILEQNYDIAEGVLKVLVNNIIGANGINREPIPRKNDGTIHTELAKELIELWNDFKLSPEVTGQMDYAATERLAARTWVRDGELLVQMLEGKVAGLDHGTLVPFSIELIEADQLPFDTNDDKKLITQGVQRSVWGRPVAYHTITKIVPASQILHPKLAKRIKQARGVTVFASVMRRLEDLKDYEESERIAARVAAAMTGYIKKGSPDSYDVPDAGGTDRVFSMKPGMVFDGLQEGEEVGTIDSNRPSGLLTPFHNAMLRFASAGVGTSYSSTSKNYDGTYSAQRQELVESRGNYEALTNLWIGQFSRPVWRRFVDMAVAARLIAIPSDLNINTLYDADFRGPSMPWIDPVKEVIGNKMQERAGYKSAQQIIRERGGNPDETMEQIDTWRKSADDKRLWFDTDPAKTSGTGTAQDYLREREGLSTTDNDDLADAGLDENGDEENTDGEE